MGTGDGPTSGSGGRIGEIAPSRSRGAFSQDMADFFAPENRSIERGVGDIKEAEGYSFQARYPNSELFLIDVDKFNKDWKNVYIEPGGRNQNHDRYDDFNKFLNKNKDLVILAPEVYGADPELSNSSGFINGRHRFSALRDRGVKTMWVAIDPSQKELFQKKYSPDNEQASNPNANFPIPPKSVFTESANPENGIILASPNRIDESQIRDAKIKLSSSEQKNFHTITNKINKAFNINAQKTSVIGSWQDGAENSMLAEIDKISLDELKAVASLYGYAGEQKAVIYFKPNSEGKAGLYNFTTVAQDPEKLREELLDLGIIYHTIVPTNELDHYRVYVFEENISQEGIAATKSAAKSLNDGKDSPHITKPTFFKGDGAFIGNFDSRDEATKVYSKEIIDYMNKYPESSAQIIDALRFWRHKQDTEPPDEVREQQLKALRPQA